MNEARKGVLAIAGAATIWGCRASSVLLAQGRAAEARALAARPRAWAILGLSAVTIGANWLGFIHAVQTGQALEASLGYYIFPLIAVALGFLVLGERFTVVQSLAIGLAAAAVVVLTIGLGAPPWMALMLAATFAAYGLIKRWVSVGPLLSVFVETLILSPLALLWLWGMHTGAWTDLGGRAGGMFGHDLATSLLLACSGPLTGGPLMLFSYAARRIPYATLGLVQYLNPTLQFIVAMTLFGEAFTWWHAVAFALIWSGLALYSGEAWRQERAARSRETSAGTLS